MATNTILTENNIFLCYSCMLTCMQVLLTSTVCSQNPFKARLCPEMGRFWCRFGSSCRASTRNKRAQERQEAGQVGWQDYWTQGCRGGVQRSRYGRAEQENQEDQGRHIDQWSARPDQAEGQQEACHGQPHGSHLLPKLDALLVF